MTTTDITHTDVVTYEAPGGASDFHRIADQLAEEHPRNVALGRWKIEFTGTHYRFTWIAA